MVSRSPTSNGKPIYADFLAYALTKILGIVDVLDLARSHHYLGGRVRSSSRVAGLDVAGRVQVVLHHGVARIRSLPPCGRGNCWRRRSPISGARTSRSTTGAECAAHYGTLAIGPLLGSLRSVPSLTKEQRDQLPLILETIGPSIIPALVRHLHDPHEHVRAIVAAALGQLHALETVPSLAALVQDPSDVVRQSVVEALGVLGSSSTGPRTRRGASLRAAGSRVERIAWSFRLEKACRPLGASRPGRAGRGDAGVCPGRRLGGGADPGRPGAGPDRSAGRGGRPRG